MGWWGPRLRGALQAAGTLRWNVNNWGYLTTTIWHGKATLKQGTWQHLQTLAHVSCQRWTCIWSQICLKDKLLDQVGGKHRAMCESALGVQKKESAFQWFLNFCTVKISVLGRLSWADLPSHYSYFFCKPNKKGMLDIQGKKSLSSLMSVKNAQKRQGINVWGVRWVRRREAARTVV